MNTDSSFEKEVRLEDVLPLIREQLDAGKPVCICPKGTSMLPMLRQGIDSVVLSPLPKKLKKYDLPLYRRDNGAFVLHRVVKAGETYTCVGDNQFHLEKGLRHDQMIAVVTGFYRAERYCPVAAPTHQLYCRFWHYTRFFRRCWRWFKRQVKRILK